MEWFQENWLILLSLVIVVAAVVAIFLVSYFQKKKYGAEKATTRDLTMGAVCIAASFALSFFGYKLPQGGTITPASVLPVMLYCHYCGIGKSAIVVVAFTLLQFMQNPYIMHPFQVILDYFIPYLSLIFVAIIPFKREKYFSLMRENKNTMSSHVGLFIGAAIYLVVRYISHVLSGAIFFGEYAWDGWGKWPYSFAYNSFAVVDAVIAVAVGAALFANKAFNAFMAKTFDRQKHTDTRAENDEGAGAGADEG